jgi:branched-chain amino acid transport system ATP-binding protein
MAMLELIDLRVTLERLVILRGVTLRVDPGTVVGLIGRNGAGKTTTLRAIIGLASVASGEVRLDGVDLSTRPPYARAAAGIGYVPEDRRLIGALSVRDNVLMPAWARHLDDADHRFAVITELMPELVDLASRPAVMLSGGQQKLVALARSFMNGRRLILLDEPFEGVAPPLARRLLRAVQEFQQREPGLAVLIAESEVKWVKLLADTTYVIERGTTVKG